MDREDQLIEKIMRAVPSEKGARKLFASHRGRVSLGIGDDAAVIASGGKADWVVSCDAFMEDVHFLADSHPADSVGYKSLARATSDLAAMGATPQFFLLTLALPKDRTGIWLDGFLKGMGRATRELKMRLIGGDTTRFSKVAISITVIGEIAPGRAVTRANARPGDIICVSGRLGRAQVGLEIVRSFPHLVRKPSLRSRFALLQQHLYPKIRVRLGSWLAHHRIASAMMDISDGLSTDLARMCSASRVGARLWADRIPQVEIPPSVRRLVGKARLDPLQMALNGGDDYELLFTLPRGRVKRLRAAPGFREITAIGEIERGHQVVLVGPNGRAKRLQPGGWDPFRRK